MEIILKYFPDLTKKKIEQFYTLRDLYSRWNEKINLISRKDIPYLYLHHVLHSLAIAKFFPFKPGTKILDAGTGGGFPGVPLAILLPEVEFYLADSVGKKINAVKSITSDLGLSNTTVIKTRIEELNEKYDFIVCRAVTSFQTMVLWVSMLFEEINRHLFSNGLIYLKGGELDEELWLFKEKVTVFTIQEIFQESYFETKKIIYLPAKESPD
jgi:16S rRNA (guanine527-N7)-methyltransferase